MIDFKLEIKKIQPINIKEMELNRYRLNNNIKKSIILYNTAIGEMKKNNLDLAINDLKKALSYNKSFSEAIKFMGLCYVNIKEYRKAKNTFKKLAKYEICRDLANEYIESLITTRKSISKTTKNMGEVKYNTNNKKKVHSITKSLRGKIVIGLSIIMIVMAGFIINYLYPLNIQGILEKYKPNKNIVDSEKKINENLDEEDSSSEYEKNTVIYEDYENVQKALEDTKSELDSYKNKYNSLNMLNDADTSFKNGDYENAASILISMKSTDLDDETKLKFDKLWQNLKTSGVWTIYNQGNKLYKEGKYEEALPKLKIASEIDPNLNIMPWATYQIGVCYKEMNDNTNALIFFQKVEDNYPKSSYASNAKMMINQIGQKE